MKISDYKKLEEKINGQSFNQGYRNINILMLVLSIFGHFASIFLAYFMMSKILSGAMTDNPVAVFIASIIILSGLELLKRDIFDKFSVQYLKLKTFSKDVMPLFILSVAIIGASFYASINGAKEFSSKEDLIDSNKKQLTLQLTDSITQIYLVKTSGIESEIKETKSKLENKDKEQTDLESIQPPTRSAKQRIKDLKDEKKTLRDDISKLESNLKIVNTERDSIINSKKTEIEVENSNKKEDNSSNSIAFVIISTLIEIIILAGVYFNQYYKFRSYREFRNKIEKDPNFQKWMLFEQMLTVIYSEDTKINQKLPSNKLIIDMCKVNDIIVLPKDVTDFLKILSNLGIIKSSGSTRYISKQRESSFEALKKHFNIQ